MPLLFRIQGGKLVYNLPKCNHVYYVKAAELDNKQTPNDAVDGIIIELIQSYDSTVVLAGEPDVLEKWVNLSVLKKCAPARIDLPTLGPEEVAAITVIACTQFGDSQHVLASSHIQISSTGTCSFFSHKLRPHPPSQYTFTRLNT